MDYVRSRLVLVPRYGTGIPLIPDTRYQVLGKVPVLAGESLGVDYRYQGTWYQEVGPGTKTKWKRLMTPPRLSTKRTVSKFCV